MTERYKANEISRQLMVTATVPKTTKKRELFCYNVNTNWSFDRSKTFEKFSVPE